MGKKKQLIWMNIIVIGIAVTYALVLIFGNVFSIKASVATNEGSYGYQYVRNHHLNQVELTDDMLEYFDIRYETFDYNVQDNSLELVDYNGISRELVIPNSISGLTVKSLSEDFIKSLSTVKALYLPDNVVTVEGEANESLIIYCKSTSKFYNGLMEQAGETGDWNVQLLSDSEFENFDLGDIPFSYNISDDEAEIVHYNGTDIEVLVIPSYINGYPVTEVSMDLVGIADVVVIPATVTKISGKSSLYIFTVVFYIELIFSLLAFLLSLIAVNIILPKYNKLKDYLLRGNQIIIVVMYVAFQTIFGIASIGYLNISAYLSLIISLIILVVFIVLMYLSKFGMAQVETVEEKISEQTQRMNRLKESTKYLADNIKDVELKKQVQILVEEIRYSAISSKPEEEAIETEIEVGIKKLEEAIRQNDEKEISEISDVVLKLVKKRNEKFKN